MNSRRITNNKSGVATWLVLLIVIIILLVAWEGFGTYLNFTKPSDVFSGIYPEDEDVYFNLSFRNKVTGQVITPRVWLSGLIWQIHWANETQSGAVYEMIIRSNAPPNILSEKWTINVWWDEWNETAGVYQALTGGQYAYKVSWWSLVSNTFTFDTPINYANSYRVYVKAYSPNGVRFPINPNPTFPTLDIESSSWLGVQRP
jgi:hypothetical protein